MWGWGACAARHDPQEVHPVDQEANTGGASAPTPHLHPLPPLRISRTFPRKDEDTNNKYPHQIDRAIQLTQFKITFTIMQYRIMNRKQCCESSDQIHNDTRFFK